MLFFDFCRKLQQNRDCERVLKEVMENIELQHAVERITKSPQRTSRREQKTDRL